VAVVIAIVMNVSAAAITCSPSHQALSMSVGQQAPVYASCTYPAGFCSSDFSISGPLLYTWAPTPIVGMLTQEVGNESVKFTAMFRGFDNMMGDQEAVTETFTHRINCTQGNDTETALFNLTVHMAKSVQVPRAKALEPPASIPVGCLVQDVETRVLVNFSASNSSATHQSLMSGWKKSDKDDWSAWVPSRPLSATRKSQGSEDSYDADSQPILQSIEAGPDSKSLYLVLKPPSSEASLRGSDSVSWKLCMIPADGLNYYKQLCTETFPVMSSQAQCDSTGTSGAASLRAPLVSVLAMITSVIVLAATP